ncbi:MAG TPA: sterol desaturase family protein [Fibrobacteria bacterium]|nr:sterol desaturase family protein [Fibrobacteria bacterium]
MKHAHGASAPDAFRKTVAYGLYPLLLATVLGIIALAVRFQWDFQAVYWKTTIFILAVLMTVERVMPLSREWSMTGRSFLRDFRYILLDGPTIGLTKAAFGWLVIRYSGSHQGPLSHLPVWAGAAIFLLAFEFFQYWFHRLSHEAKGPAGRFLWRTHLAHHLPDKVYVMMHAVFHPLNALISTVIIQAPLMLLGVSPGAALAATLLIDLQSLASHCNADLRAGWLSYVFIGTETHRYHHSAKLEEARNFGNTLAAWDLVFGTFLYRPGKAPEKLGLEGGKSGEGHYPRSEKLLEVLAFPFIGNVEQAGTERRA